MSPVLSVIGVVIISKVIISKVIKSKVIKSKVIISNVVISIVVENKAPRLFVENNLTDWYLAETMVSCHNHGPIV